MSCIMTCSCRSRKNDVSPNNSDIGHTDKPANKTGEKSSHIEGIELKSDSPTREKNAIVAIYAKSNKLKTDEEDENLRQEWMELAQIVDRMLLYIFTTIHILMILLIFVIMPNTWNSMPFRW